LEIIETDVMVAHAVIETELPMRYAIMISSRDHFKFCSFRGCFEMMNAIDFVPISLTGNFPQVSFVPFGLGILAYSAKQNL